MNRARVYGNQKVRVAVPPVQIGTEFHAHYADGNPRWRVIGKQGRDAWRCEVVESPDWHGTVKLYSTQEIQRAVAQSKVFEDLRQIHDDWYAKQEIGSVVHYDNGFGEQWVRGRIALVDGKKQIIPTALVGSRWGTHDLPNRRPDGVIHYPYHADKILKGEAFQPNESSIYEANPEKYRRLDPRNLPTIDLTVPELDADGQANAKLFQLRAQIIKDLQEVTTGNIRSTLASIKASLEQALTTP
jgi:hypothetical protein